MASASEVRDLVKSFPETFGKAVVDLARYKLALSRGLVGIADQQKISRWFYDFPQLWAIVRPNWEETIDGRAPSAGQLAFAGQVNRWILHLRGDAEIKQTAGLGVIFTIIAGVAIVAALVGATGWAIGYVKEQSNNSKLIDGALEGKIPADIVGKAVAKDSRSFLGTVSDVTTKVATFGMIGAALFLFWPVIRGAIGGRRA